MHTGVVLLVTGLSAFTIGLLFGLFVDDRNYDKKQLNPYKSEPPKGDHLLNDLCAAHKKLERDHENAVHIIERITMLNENLKHENDNLNKKYKEYRQAYELINSNYDILLEKHDDLKKQFALHAANYNIAADSINERVKDLKALQKKYDDLLLTHERLLKNQDSHGPEFCNGSHDHPSRGTRYEDVISGLQKRMDGLRDHLDELVESQLECADILIEHKEAIQKLQGNNDDLKKKYDHLLLAHERLFGESLFNEKLKRENDFLKKNTGCHETCILKETTISALRKEVDFWKNICADHNCKDGKHIYEWSKRKCVRCGEDKP